MSPLRHLKQWGAARGIPSLVRGSAHLPLTSVRWFDADGLPTGASWAYMSGLPIYFEEGSSVSKMSLPARDMPFEIGAVPSKSTALALAPRPFLLIDPATNQRLCRSACAQCWQLSR